jgi:anti-sigma B factor antagonist
MAGTSVPLSIHLRADGIAVVSAPSMLDKDTAPRLRTALVALTSTETVPRIVLDCGGVEFADSTGLGVLVGARKRAGARNGVVVLADVSERIRKTLRVTGLLKLFTAYATASDAVEALAVADPEDGTDV